MNFTAIFEGLLAASTGDALVEVGLVEVDDDALLLEATARSEPIAEQMFSVPDVSRTTSAAGIALAPRAIGALSKRRGVT